MTLGPLSRLNVVIGPNNTGKSRLLRKLFADDEQKGLFQALAADIPSLQAMVHELRQNRYSSPTFSNAAHLAQFTERLRIVAENAWPWIDTSKSLEDLATVSKELLSLARQHWFRSHPYPTGGSESVHRVFRHFRPLIHGPDVRVYIPALRTTRSLQRDWDGSNVLAEEVRSRYFPNLSLENLNDSSQTQVIMTGERLYTMIRRKLLGNLADRKMIASFQDFLAKTFFQGEPVTLIPKETGSGEHDRHTLHIAIGSEAEQPVHLLGDGVSQLLIMLFPLFEFRNTNLSLYIEEPELFLHPGMQRQFIDALVNDASEGGAPLGSTGTRQAYVATHSSVFIDLAVDSKYISFFRTSKSFEDANAEQRLPTIEVELLATPDRSLLRALGVQNSSVLIANATIWVEGPSDRIYLRHFINLYNQTKAPSERLRENIDFVIAEYAGSNLVHWYFDPVSLLPETDEAFKIWVSRLCGQPMVIADRDDTEAAPGTEKARNLQKLKKMLDRRFYRLDVREIENLLTPEAIMETLVSLKGPRADELLKFKEFSQDDYKDVRIGSFIRDRVVQRPDGYTPKVWNPASAGESTFGSALKMKTQFALASVECMKEYDKLSESAKQLVQEVVWHVRDACGRSTS